MKTRLVYILISDESDIYLEQLLLSVFTARYHNPSAKILVIVDERTKSSISGRRTGIERYVSEIVVVSVPESYSKMQRSRYLKTSLRNLIDGDFLFIDTDTIICDDLSKIDQYDFSIGATTDGNGDLLINYKDPKWGLVKMQCSQCGIPDTFENEPYFNSGVLYVKDDAISKKFFTLWHAKWKRNIGYGVNRDQFPLLCTNFELGHIIKELPAEYNCQVTEQGLQTLYKAKIIHYYAMVDTNFLLGQKTVIEEIKKDGLTEQIKKMAICGAKGAFDDNARIIVPKNNAIESTYIYQLYTSSKFGFKIVNALSKYVYNVIVFGVGLRNIYRKRKNKVQKDSKCTI